MADSWAAFLELLGPFYTSENFSSISAGARCRISAVQGFAFLLLVVPGWVHNHAWLICQLWMSTAHIPVQVNGRQIRLIGGTDDVKHLIQGWSSWQTQMMQCVLSLQPSQGSPGHSENGLSPLVLMSKFASCFYMKEWEETISPFCPLWKMNSLDQI